MHPDARITILGGVPIGLAVLAAGGVCQCQVLITTGTGLLGAALAFAVAVEATCEAAAPE
jgi:hypothetical protein